MVVFCAIFEIHASLLMAMNVTLSSVLPFLPVVLHVALCFVFGV